MRWALSALCNPHLTPALSAAKGQRGRELLGVLEGGVGLDNQGAEQAYVTAITAAARQLVEQALVPEEDGERATAAAADWGGPRHDIKLK